MKLLILIFRNLLNEFASYATLNQVWLVTGSSLNNRLFAITQPTPEIFADSKRFGSIKMEILGISLFVSQHANLRL